MYLIYLIDCLSIEWYDVKIQEIH